jgi:flavin-dependent dehydrogenase
VHEFDVAVVGAGPAGATVARELASTGVRTALIERAHLPRYKSCAGGIPVRTARLRGPSSYDDEVRRGRLIAPIARLLLR